MYGFWFSIPWRDVSRTYVFYRHANILSFSTFLTQPPRLSYCIIEKRNGRSLSCGMITCACWLWSFFLLLSFHVSLVTWFRNFCTFCFLTYMTWHCHCLSPPFILLASFHVSTVEVNFLYGCFAAKSDELVCFGNREIKICLLRIHTKHQNNIFLSRKLKGNLRLTL